MARIATIVLVLGVCMSETSLAGVVFEAGEVDSSTVKLNPVPMSRSFTGRESGTRCQESGRNWIQ